MSFIMIDGKEPINLDRVVTFRKESDKYSDTARGPLIVFYIKSGNFFWWSFKSHQERDRAYDFLIRKTCIRYTARDKIAEALKKAKEEAFERIVALIKRRRKPFGVPMIAGREVSLLEYHDHQKEIIQNRGKSSPQKGPKNWMNKLKILGVRP